MKAGLGATFSSTGKLSSRMLSVPKGPADMSMGLKASATCPMAMALVMAPCSNHALTVSTSDAFSPGSCSSGCLMVALAELLKDRPERIDCVSDAAWSSDRSDLCGCLRAGDAGCGRGAGVGNVVAIDPEPADGNGGGTSPIFCNSAAIGLGTKMVLRTSRRPRSVEARLGGAACYGHIRPHLQQGGENSLHGGY